MAQTGDTAEPTFIGRYRIEGPLGSGGVGLVYAAHDPVLGRRVAVKLLRPERSGVAAAGERLREEAQAMARLAHPNVVTVFDVGEHAGGFYIAMELVDGLSLRGWLTETPRPWREVLAAYFQAGRGLAAAHDAGLVHRDFKPANVLMGRDGRVRVVDFGLASEGSGASTLPHVPAEDGEITEPFEGSDDYYHRPTRLTEVERTIDEQGARGRASAGASAPSLVLALDVDGPSTRDVLRTGDELRTQEASRLDMLRDALRTSDGLRTQDGSRVDMRRDALLTGDAVHTSDGLRTLVGPEVTADGSLLQTMLPDPAVTQAGVVPARWVAGTPAYMAPELFMGRPADARSDQFAFCVSLYEGLYGRRPFAGETSIEIAEEVLAGRILPPPKRTQVPRWIHAIIEQGLAMHRQDRHPSVRSLLASIAFLARVVWN
jgi:serine/threonine protein kinase